MKKSKPIEVKRGNVAVKIYTSHTTKKGQTYPEFKVVDYSNRKRKLWTFAHEAKAREKAAEIADATIRGQAKAASWSEDQKREFQEVLDMLEPTEITIKEVATLFCRAISITGGQPGHLLVAAQFYMANRPDKPFQPKRIQEAVSEFLAAQKDRVCERRLSALTLPRSSILQNHH